MVSPRSAPLHGGIESHVQNLSKEIVKQGHKVTVVTQRVKKDELPQAATIDGVEYIYFDNSINSYDGISSELINFIVNNNEGFDVIHLQAIHKPLSLWALKKLKNCKTKIVFTPHYHGTGHTRLAVAAHKFYQPLVRRYINKCETVIAVSDVEAELLATHFPKISDNIKIVPNGIIPPVDAPAFEKTMPVILSVGRLEPYKRVDEIILNLPDNVQLVIVGEGKDSGRLTQIAEAKNMTDRVLFVGKISDHDLARWWSTADLFMSLSEHEAFGLSLGESITVGVPSIVSALPAHKYVASLAEAHDIVNFYDESQPLKQVITTVIADKVIKSKRDFYSWEQAATETLVIYNNVEGNK